MLARVTYGLVGLALAALIAGFFMRDSNILLYISIGLSLAAIALVVVGAARRAREAPAEEIGGEAFADVDEDEELPEDVLAAFEEDEDLEDVDEDEEDFEDEYDEEYDEEDEEEEEEEEVAPAPARAKATTKSKAKAKAKPKAASRSNKVLVVPGRDRYHDPDCRFVRDKDADEVEEITSATAKRRGYEPCSVCSPE